MVEDNSQKVPVTWMKEWCMDEDKGAIKREKHIVRCNVTAIVIVRCTRLRQLPITSYHYWQKLSIIWLLDNSLPAFLPSSRHLLRSSSVRLSLEVDMLMQTVQVETKLKELLPGWFCLTSTGNLSPTGCTDPLNNAVHSFLHHRRRLWSVIVVI